ncbi:MAG: glycoside hydrolase family 32 protein, partial [Clostridia bacterium]|nr:glycoside hydrolase family 32 protein [Clostridia bacterium]
DTPIAPDAIADTNRPAFHFTAPLGWLNDPNGCYFDGKHYHLFYQHNPVDPNWGNMHWGHAVSSDLIHWEHRPIALFPDEMGTMFSGSAIIDHDNASGLGDGVTPPVLLYYTAAGNTSVLSKDKRFTQCMAYSTDGGNTFRKYEQNPVIAWVEAENRDPKVWPMGDGSFVLALYLANDRYALFTSRDLLHWTQTQTIALPGDDECPDIFPLGDRWVLMGASGWYLTGSLKDGVFTDDGAPVRRFGFDFGKDAYAAQTFYTTDDTRTRIAWLRWHQAGRHGQPYGSSMTLPHTLSLQEIDGVCYLCSTPIALPEPKNGEDCIPQSIPARMDCTVWEGQGSVTISVCGCTLTIDGANVTWNGSTFTLPKPIQNFTVIIDRFSLEIFGGDGLLHLVRSIPLSAEVDFQLKLDGDIAIETLGKEW